MARSTGERLLCAHRGDAPVVNGDTARFESIEGHPVIDYNTGDGAVTTPAADESAPPSAVAGAPTEVKVGDATGRYRRAAPESPPAAGKKLGLLIVLPGGDGSADFHPFVRNIQRQAIRR